MDDNTRTDILHRIFDEAVESIVQETDMEAMAAHRAMTVIGFEGLTQLLCSEHLEEELGKFARWIQHERDVLRPAEDAQNCATAH